jgi:hypothetical protein
MYNIKIQSCQKNVIPDVIVEYICSFLTIDIKIHIRKINKQWNKISKTSSIVWKNTSFTINIFETLIPNNFYRQQYNQQQKKYIFLKSNNPFEYKQQLYFFQPNLSLLNKYINNYKKIFQSIPYITSLILNIVSTSFMWFACKFCSVATDLCNL